MFIGISNAVTRGENVWGPLGLFANGEAGASWNVLGYSVIGEAITSITDSSGNDISLANAVTAQQPAYDETEDGIKYAFFDLDDSLSATLPDLGADASKWTVTPYAVHVETGQTIGAGSYTAPTNDWGAHGVIDREVTATEINRIVSWAKRNKLTGVDYPTLKTRMDVICMNAVDVFVYDTTQDSDGGAWRTGSLAQASSWYNETLNTATRGARREFPAVAVIVAEATKVTIYDGDDPALPMWKSFSPTSLAGGKDWWRNSRVASSVAASNGLVCIGKGAGPSYDGLSYLNFPDDSAGRYYKFGNHGTISPLTAVVDTEVSGSLPEIVDTVINDVAMTVLPDAPIDPATGLPVPTIAVATDGGVSVIKDDGTVVDITGILSGSETPDHAVLFDLDNSLWLVDRGFGTFGFYLAGFNSIPNADTTVSSADFKYSTTSSTAVFGDLRTLGRTSHLALDSSGGSSGLTKYAHRLNANEGMVAYTTSTYNTGWMNGDIRGAFLSDTDDTDLVGSGELVTNGTFDTDTDWTKGTGWTISGGVASASSALNSSLIQSPFTTTAGMTYAITYTISGYTSGAIRPLLEGTIGTYRTSNGTFTDYIVSPSSSARLIFTTSGSTTLNIDNISVKLADADRSVNNKGLIVNGTITRSPVADGAEIVAYSGFSASNYLEQPYNPDLDFGTGDFCVMGWVKPSALTFLRCILELDGGLRIVQNVGKLAAYSTALVTSNLTLATSAWQFISVRRSSGQLYFGVNGVEDAPVANNQNVGQSGVMTIGYGTNPEWAGSLALLRISATAPTAEQIAKIYEDELPLFQEKAACTLAGSGDAVTALAHDPTTGVLRAAQSDKTSLFIGLERVGEEDGKATCIAASNGIVAGI